MGFGLTLTLTSCPCRQAFARLLGASFQRLCLFPDKINKCFDWDLDGTRW